MVQEDASLGAKLAASEAAVAKHNQLFAGCIVID